MRETAAGPRSSIQGNIGITIYSILKVTKTVHALTQTLKRYRKQASFTDIILLYLQVIYWLMLQAIIIVILQLLMHCDSGGTSGL